ncbi:hypothetical protein ACYZTM_20135 [Pseudomonas sp. MDT2-39-1]
MQPSEFSPLEYNATASGSMSGQDQYGRKFNANTYMLHTGGKNGGIIRFEESGVAFSFSFPGGLVADTTYTKTYPEDFTGASFSTTKSNNGVQTEARAGTLTIRFSNSKAHSTTNAKGSIEYTYTDGSIFKGTFDVTNTYSK